MDNDCSYYELLISKRLDDGLTKEEENSLKEHLLTCKSCKAFLDNALIINTLLDKDLSLKPIPLPKIKRQFMVRLPVWVKIAACFLILTVGSFSGIKLGEGVVKVLSSEQQQYVYLDDDMASLSPSDDNGLDIDEISP